MAYTDNLNQLFDVAAIEQQKNTVVGFLDDYVQKVTAASQKISEVETSFFSDSAGLAQLAKDTKEAITLTKEQIASVKALADEKVKLAQAELLAQKAETESEKTKRASLLVEKELQKQYDDGEKKRNKAAELLAKESNAYEQLKKQYNEAALRAKALYIELGKNNQATQDAITLAQKYHTQLTAAEQAVGQFQRQVGNYNGVGAQFNQLLRELPNAGISAQTFLISLSNNITYFVEAVALARAEGQSLSMIMGTLGTSLLGPVGIINLLVLGVTYLSTTMMNQKDVLEEYKELVDKQTDALKKYNDELEKAFKNSVSNENRELLIARGKAEIEQLKAKGNAADEVYRKEQDLLNLELRSLKAKYETVKATDAEKAFEIKKDIIAKEGELETARIRRLKESAEEHQKYADKIKKIYEELRKEILQAIADTPDPNKVQTPFSKEGEGGSIFDPLRQSGLFGDVKGTPNTPQERSSLYDALNDYEASEKYRKLQEAAAKKRIEDEKKEQAERLKNMRAFASAANSIVDGLNAIQQARTDKEIARLKRESDLVDVSAQRQIAALQRSGLSLEQKQEKEDEINARADQQKAVYAQREADRQQKQAEFEKGMAILKATIALYVGIAQEIEKGGVIGIATGAAVAAYMATVIATLSAQSVPAYADGTDNHKGGLARIGDGGEHELVRLPSGKQFISPDTDTLVNLPKGTQVIPVSDIEAMGNSNTLNGLPMLPMAYGDNSALAAAILSSNKNVVNAISNKKEVHFGWHNGELRKSVYKGGSWHTYLNSNNG
jgi:hypothetical protein